MWKFPQAEARKGDLELASDEVEIKQFQAEEAECKASEARKSSEHLG